MRQEQVMGLFALHRFHLGRPISDSLFRANPWKGLDNALGKVPVRPTHGLPSEARFPSLRPQVPWQLSTVTASKSTTTKESIWVISFAATFPVISTCI